MGFRSEYRLGIGLGVVDVRGSEIDRGFRF